MTPENPPSDAGRQAPGPWITKQQLADHFAVSTRWIELQQRRGLPYLRVSGVNRYRISEVEAWLRQQHSASANDN